MTRVSRVRSVEERSSSVAVSSQLTVVQLVHLVTTRTHTQNGPPLNYREIDRDVMRSTGWQAGYKIIKIVRPGKPKKLDTLDSEKTSSGSK